MHTRSSASRLRRALIILAALFAVAWFTTLEYRGLFIPDEGRYAEIPREMLASGDWVTPRLNDLKYFEKPPLQYWLTALSFAVLGEDEWTARLPAALLGFLSVLMVAFTARRLWDGQAALFAAAMLGSCWGFYLSGQYLTLDMTLSAFLTIALCAFLLAQHATASRREARDWMLISWAAAACAVLSKGLVGVVLPAMALSVYSLVAGDWRVWRHLQPLRGAAVFLLIVLPWFVLVQQRNADFFHFFFIHEHFDRFTATGHGRPGAWWYYLPIVVIGLMPWTPLLISRAVESLRAPRQRTANFNVEVFCVIWALAITAFFSASHSKLPAYIIPALPALVLWMTRLSSTRRQAAMRYCVVSVVGLSVAIAIAIRYLSQESMLAALGQDGEHGLPLLYAAASLLGLSGVISGLATLRGKPYLALISLASGTFLFWITVFGFLHRVDDEFSAEKLIEALTQEQLPFFPNAPFYSVDQFDHSVPFYLGRTLTLVNSRGELGFGIDAEPHKAIASIASFESIWRGTSSQAFAVMTPDQYRRFEQAGLPMIKLQANLRLVVVSRMPFINRHASSTTPSRESSLPSIFQRTKR